MPNEPSKPFGWRPLSSEARDRYRSMGWADEQIDEIEATNVYCPDPTAVQAFEIASCMLAVLSDQFGDEFAAAVQGRLKARVEALSLGSTEDQVEAPMVAQLLK